MSRSGVSGSGTGIYRGIYTNAAVYAVNDLALLPAGQLAACVVAHTAGATPTNANWAPLVDNGLYARTQAVTTTPSLVLSTVPVLTSGRIDSAKTRVQVGGTYTKIQCRCTALGTSVTDFRMSVCDSAGTKLTETAQASASLSTSVIVQVALLASVVVNAGDVLYLGVGAIAATGPTLRGDSVGDSVLAALTDLKSGLPAMRSQTGWTTGNVTPNVTSAAATGARPYLELVA